MGLGSRGSQLPAGPAGVTWGEDRFTAPVDWCRNPQRWHSMDGDATELEVTELVAAFVRALQPELVVETGSHVGQTTAAIGAALQCNGHGRLWSVEVEPYRAALAAEKTTGLPVTVVCADSAEWEPPKGIGFGWFDSGSMERGAERGAEIDRWLHLFVPGAIVGVHDTGPQHPFLGQLAPLIEAGALRSALTLRTPRGVTFAEVCPP